MRRTLEEECNGNLQDVRDVLQSTRADAVGALLVLLHLLECQAERVAEVCLAHRKHHPSHAYAAADVPVDRIWGLHGHPAALRGCSRDYTGKDQQCAPSCSENSSSRRYGDAGERRFPSEFQLRRVSQTSFAEDVAITGHTNDTSTGAALSDG